MADEDDTKGIDDRRRLLDRGEEAVRAARETWAPLAVAMVSIDGLDAIAADDAALGEGVIAAVARRVRGLVRVEDALGHYGDDGFAVIVHGGPRGALELADRLRTAIAATPFEVADRSVRVTLSVGVAVFSPRDEGLAELLGRADGALDQARRAGANRVVAV